jgi:hypothetical protein
MLLDLYFHHHYEFAGDADVSGKPAKKSKKTRPRNHDERDVLEMMVIVASSGMLFN